MFYSKFCIIDNIHSFDICMNPPVYNKYVNGKGRFLEICYEEKWIYFGDKRYLNIRVNLGSEGRRDRVDRFSASLSKWGN